MNFACLSIIPAHDCQNMAFNNTLIYMWYSNSLLFYEYCLFCIISLNDCSISLQYHAKFESVLVILPRFNGYIWLDLIINMLLKICESFGDY